MDEDDFSWITGLGKENCVQKINNNYTTTITKFVKLQTWYNNNLACGVDWKHKRPNLIYKKILEHFSKYDKLQRIEERKKSRTTTMTTVPGYNNPSTKRSYLQSLLSILNNENV